MVKTRPKKMIKNERRKTKKPKEENFIRTSGKNTVLSRREPTERGEKDGIKRGGVQGGRGEGF